MLTKIETLGLASEYETTPAIVKEIYDWMAVNVDDADTATELAEGAMIVLDGLDVDEELFFEIAVLFYE